MKYSKKYRTEKSLYRLFNKFFRAMSKNQKLKPIWNSEYYSSASPTDLMFIMAQHRTVQEMIKRRHERNSK